MEKIVWEQIEALLSNPEVILASVKTMQSEVQQIDPIEEDLMEVERRLKSLVGEQDQLLQWALTGFPEDTILKENERINRMREQLVQRRAELEVRLEQARQTEFDDQRIEQFCEIVKQNMKDFSFENRRLALQALRIKVWINGGNINIEGTVPMSNYGIISTTS